MFEENNEIMTHTKCLLVLPCTMHVSVQGKVCVCVCMCLDHFIPIVLISAEGRTQGEKPERPHLDKLTLLEQDVSVETVAQCR